MERGDGDARFVMYARGEDKLRRHFPMFKAIHPWNMKNRPAVGGSCSGRLGMPPIHAERLDVLTPSGRRWKLAGSMLLLMILSQGLFLTVAGHGVAPDMSCDPVVVEVGAQGVGPFNRGDCDGNGRFGGTPTEAIVGLTFTFRGGTEPPCQAACDAEANGVLAITDYVRILRSAFLGLGQPDPPFPGCTTSNLASDVTLGCEQPFCLP